MADGSAACRLAHPAASSTHQAIFLELPAAPVHPLLQPPSPHLLLRVHLAKAGGGGGHGGPPAVLDAQGHLAPRGLRGEGGMELEFAVGSAAASSIQVAQQAGYGQRKPQARSREQGARQRSRRPSGAARAPRAPPCSAAGAAARAGTPPCSSAPPAPTPPLRREERQRRQRRQGERGSACWMCSCGGPVQQNRRPLRWPPRPAPSNQIQPTAPQSTLTQAAAHPHWGSAASRA